jgi:hypothetical protein
MTRYDDSRGSYKPAHTVARGNPACFDGVQFGDLVAIHDDRVGVRWDAEAYEERRTFEVLPLSDLPALMEEAKCVLQAWDEQQMAEIAAETNIPQHLVW